MAEANAFSLCVYIVKTQGLSGLYRGLPMELFRGVLSGNRDWRDAASQSREDAMANRDFAGLSGALVLMVREQAEIVATRLLLGGR